MGGKGCCSCVRLQKTDHPGNWGLGGKEEQEEQDEQEEQEQQEQQGGVGLLGCLRTVDQLPKQKRKAVGKGKGKDERMRREVDAWFGKSCARAQHR